MASKPHAEADADADHQAHSRSAVRDFHHPYTPYAIQETFMSTVYHVLDQGTIGILESPTGTVSPGRLGLYHVIIPTLHDQMSNPIAGKVSQSDLWCLDLVA